MITVDSNRGFTYDEYTAEVIGVLNDFSVATTHTVSLEQMKLANTVIRVLLAGSACW